MTHTPTPTAPRAVTLHLHDSHAVPIGAFAARLVPNPTGPDSGASAITHALGSLAGGTYTEVSFVDGTAGNRDLLGDGSFRDDEREALRDSIVRTIANSLYAGTWAFQYPPNRVEDAVHAHRVQLRERIEVSEVELW